jgi:predicted  nucleic acid-binding Zn-ribbon protein
MAKKNENQQTRLESDIEHLRDEIASIELMVAHATGQDLDQMRNDQQELRETMQSKQRLLSAMNKESNGQWAGILGLVVDAQQDAK